MPIPFEKILTPGVRAGNTVERVGKMIEAGVCKIAIAAQMTHNSTSGKKYTAHDVELLGSVFNDCKSKVLVTSAQATAMRDDAADGHVFA